MESLRKPHSTQDRRFRVAWCVLRNKKTRSRNAAHSTQYVRALLRKDWGKPQSLSQQNRFLSPYVNMGLYENERSSEVFSVAGRIHFDSGWWFGSGEGTKLGCISYYVIFTRSCLSVLSFQKCEQAKIPNLLFPWAQKNLHRPDIEVHLGNYFQVVTFYISGKLSTNRLCSYLAVLIFI